MTRGGTLTRRSALTRIVGQASAELEKTGFVAVEKRRWIYSQHELKLVIELQSKGLSYGVWWGIVSPESVRYVWPNVTTNVIDVGVAIISGSGNSIDETFGGLNFFLQDDVISIGDVQRLITRFSDGLAPMCAYLKGFQTRNDVLSYLMKAIERRGKRGFVVPSPSLGIYICAVLALLDRNSLGYSLANDARAALDRFRGSEVTEMRLERLDQLERSVRNS